MLFRSVKKIQAGILKISLLSPVNVVTGAKAKNYYVLRTIQHSGVLFAKLLDGHGIKKTGFLGI